MAVLEATGPPTKRCATCACQTKFSPHRVATVRSCVESTHFAPAPDDRSGCAMCPLDTHSEGGRDRRFNPLAHAPQNTAVNDDKSIRDHLNTAALPERRRFARNDASDVSTRHIKFVGGFPISRPAMCVESTHWLGRAKSKRSTAQLPRTDCSGEGLSRWRRFQFDLASGTSDICRGGYLWCVESTHEATTPGAQSSVRMSMCRLDTCASIADHAIPDSPAIILRDDGGKANRQRRRMVQ